MINPDIIASGELIMLMLLNTVIRHQGINYHAINGIRIKKQFPVYLKQA